MYYSDEEVDEEVLEDLEGYDDEEYYDEEYEEDDGFDEPEYELEDEETLVPEDEEEWETTEDDEDYTPIYPRLLTNINVPIGEVIVQPGGAIYVNVELDLEDIVGVSNYEIRVTPA